MDNVNAVAWCHPEIGLVLYDQMVKAIAECQRADEAKKMRDQAIALEVYAKQAMNHQSEIRAATVRIRAERRCGELIAVMKVHGGDRRSISRSHAATLKSIPVSKTQSSRWQQLGAIPLDEFEALLIELQEALSTISLIKQKKKAPTPVDAGPTDLFGVIHHMKAKGLIEWSVNNVVEGLRASEIPIVERDIDQYIWWLTELKAAIKNSTGDRRHGGLRCVE